MNHTFEIEELAALTCTGTTDAAEKVECIHTLLHEKYGIDLELYQRIAEDLLPFTTLVRTAVDGQYYHAFINYETQSTIIRCPPSAQAQEHIK
ncbi:hypothetical protein [Oceanospirillum sediminis]|uniref:Uncharacterized protein n=1 Tax=Oceanospirillum sediminis TaxID=2760088 RepID=A0A839IY12_9GAMM|nr:hypothetical protein [Oceanospirillum sediminis]MBB1489474.1 hypothetical protein [Oceanospirillum sediminis]